MPNRRDYGSVRRLPSGRWQARYPDPTSWTRLVTAPTTFATKAEATCYLAGVRADHDRGCWVDPSAGRMLFADYAAAWLEMRDLRPRTADLYELILRLHLTPTFGQTQLSRISPSMVRSWHATRIKSGASRGTTAKAYRLLKTILNTAVSDELILRNPCLLKGAGTETPPERVPPTLVEVEAIANAIEPRWRLLVLLAAWSGLRWGELTALTRQRIDVLHCSVRVVEQKVERKGQWQLAPPKTAAGRRTVHLPPHLLREVEHHLDTYVGPEPDAWVFCGPLGAPLMRTNFYKAWGPARLAAGLPGLHFHDLRHLAATLAATTGATTRELMQRMGHASPRAALIYQHATQDRDAAIALALSDLAAAPVVPIDAERQVNLSEAIGSAYRLMPSDEPLIIDSARMPSTASTRSARVNDHPQSEGIPPRLTIGRWAQLRLRLRTTASVQSLAVSVNPTRDEDM